MCFKMEYEILCKFLIVYLLCRSTASFALTLTEEEPQGWRHIRIQQTGKNASGQTHYLSLSGFEIYGTVTGVCDDLGNYLTSGFSVWSFPLSHVVYKITRLNGSKSGKFLNLNFLIYFHQIAFFLDKMVILMNYLRIR